MWLVHKLLYFALINLQTYNCSVFLKAWEVGYTKWESRYTPGVGRRSSSATCSSSRVHLGHPQNYFELSSWGKPVQPLGNIGTIYRCTGLKKHTELDSVIRQLEVIGQFLEPIILLLSAKSTNHNIDYNHYNNLITFSNWRNLYF